jgi:hypothetical protein
MADGLAPNCSRVPTPAAKLSSISIYRIACMPLRQHPYLERWQSTHDPFFFFFPLLICSNNICIYRDGHRRLTASPNWTTRGLVFILFFFHGPMCVQYTLALASISTVTREPNRHPSTRVHREFLGFCILPSVAPGLYIYSGATLEKNK